MLFNKDAYRHRASSIIFLSRDAWFKVSVALNIILLMSWITSSLRGPNYIRGDERTWHGGHPLAQDHKGSCWCGAADGYCMCTPSLAIDLVLASTDQQYVWLVRRRDTNQLATMGGFVDVGETVEQAVHRELKEEMGVTLSSGNGEQIQLQGVYSDPKRDNRRHNTSVVFVVHLARTIQPKAADDAKAIEKIAVTEIDQHDFFADHKTILLDYKKSLENGVHGGPAALSQGETATEAIKTALQIQRSVCTYQ